MSQFHHAEVYLKNANTLPSNKVSMFLHNLGSYTCKMLLEFVCVCVRVLVRVRVGVYNNSLNTDCLFNWYNFVTLTI
jgi:hypothetical protein